MATAARDTYAMRYERRAPAASRPTTMFLVGVVSLIAGGAGFVLPHVIRSDVVREFSWESLTSRPNVAKKSSHKVSPKQPVFIPFGEAVVNLAEERLTRHLQVRITLLANGADEALIEQSLQTNRAVLMNWLISYLSDKSLDEVRGAAGVNRARRDIQDRFNNLLFADGTERVRDVLFEEFTVR